MGKQDEDYKVNEVDIRNYARYILQKGNVFEKRDLLKNVKSIVVILGKKIALS